MVAVISFEILATFHLYPQVCVFFRYLHTEDDSKILLRNVRKYLCLERFLPRSSRSKYSLKILFHRVVGTYIIPYRHECCIVRQKTEINSE